MDSQEIQETINKIKGMRLIDANTLFNWGEYKLLDAVKYGNKSKEHQHFSYGLIMMYEVADEIDNAPNVDIINLITELQSQIKELQEREKLAEKDIKDLMEQNPNPSNCSFCKYEQYDNSWGVFVCTQNIKCTPKWRGIQEE